MTSHELENLFDTRDVEGNESEAPESESEESDSADEEDESSQPTEGSSDEDETVQSAAPSGAQPSTLYTKTMQTLMFLDSINFKTADFLNGLSWGDQMCTSDAKVRIERSIFLESPILPKILQRWAKPPRPLGSKKKRLKGAQTVMGDFAVDHLEERLSDELENIKPNMVSPPSEDVMRKTLVETSFDKLALVMKTKAPVLWRFLNVLGKKPRQKKNTHKNSEKVCKIQHYEGKVLIDIPRFSFSSFVCYHMHDHTIAVASKNYSPYISNSKGFQQRDSTRYMQWDLQ